MNSLARMLFECLQEKTWTDEPGYRVSREWECLDDGRLVSAQISKDIVIVGMLAGMDRFGVPV